MNYSATALFVAFGLIATVRPATAVTVDADDIKCEEGVARAWDKYAHCIGRHRDAHGVPPCLEKYVQAWPKLQTLSESVCGAATRWEDNGDGTVTDHLTSLIWEKKVNRDGIVNPANPHDADNLYTLHQEGADGAENGTVFTEFLAALNAGAGFAGSNGWRVPTIKEMYSIFPVNDGAACSTPPCVDPVFGDVPVTEGDGQYCTVTHSLATPAGQTCVQSTAMLMFVSASQPYRYRAVRYGNVDW